MPMNLPVGLAGLAGPSLLPRPPRMTTFSAVSPMLESVKGSRALGSPVPKTPEPEEEEEAAFQPPGLARAVTFTGAAVAAERPEYAPTLPAIRIPQFDEWQCGARFPKTPRGGVDRPKPLERTRNATQQFRVMEIHGFRSWKGEFVKDATLRARKFLLDESPQRPQTCVPPWSERAAERVGPRQRRALASPLLECAEKLSRRYVMASQA